MTNYESSKVTHYKRIEIDGKIFRIPPPVELPETELVGCEDIVQKILAAWNPLEGMPLNVRVYGAPGLGKTQLAYHLARACQKDLFVLSGQDDLASEDVSVTGTITSENSVEYVASPLFAAMLYGGILLFDDLYKAPHSSLAALASVLDFRRELLSILSGVRIRAHAEFRFMGTLNLCEEKGAGLPDFIAERMIPSIEMPYPGIEEMKSILDAHFRHDQMRRYIEALVVEFMGKKISPRSAISLLQYTIQTLRSPLGEFADRDMSVIRCTLRKLAEEMGIELSDTEEGSGGHEHSFRDSGDLDVLPESSLSVDESDEADEGGHSVH